MCAGLIIRAWLKSSRWRKSWRSCFPIKKFSFQMGSMSYGKLCLIIWIHYLYLFTLFIIFIHYLFSDIASKAEQRAHWVKTKTKSPVCSVMFRWKHVTSCALSMNAILPCLIIFMKRRVIVFTNWNTGVNYWTLLLYTWNKFRREDHGDFFYDYW